MSVHTQLLRLLIICVCVCVCVMCVYGVCVRTCVCVCVCVYGIYITYDSVLVSVLLEYKGSNG